MCFTFKLQHVCDSESICLEKTSEKTESNISLCSPYITHLCRGNILTLEWKEQFSWCSIRIRQEKKVDWREVGEHKNKGIKEEQRNGFKSPAKVREEVYHGSSPCGCVHSTCVISQSRHGALWWKHALHSAGLLGVVEAEEIGLSETQRITWEQTDNN